MGTTGGPGGSGSTRSAGVRRSVVPGLAVLGLVLAASPGTAAPGTAAPGTAAAGARATSVQPADLTADLAALVSRLTATAARAQQLADALEQSRARDGGLRRAVEELEAAHDEAVARLGARVREVYIGTAASGPAGWARLTDPAAGLLAARGMSGAVRVEQELVDAAGARSGAGAALRAEAEHFREGLRVQAAAVLAEQDAARALLAQAQDALRVQQARAQQQQAAQQAQQARARVATAVAQPSSPDAARLDAAEAVLDAVSTSVTRALTPAQTERGRRAAQAAEPVLVLLEQAGAALPAGYRPSGTQLRGTASWYGPGFVGSPTASGRPYDPERPSCAHKSLPLGTVLHVTANGRSTNCLVDDRGPYVGDRVLDLSRAGSRALGYDGTAEVVAQVLVRDQP